MRRKSDCRFRDARASIFNLMRLGKSKLPQFFRQLGGGNATALSGLDASERGFKLSPHSMLAIPAPDRRLSAWVYKGDVHP